MELRPYNMNRTGTYDKLEQCAKTIKSGKSYFAEINEDEVSFYVRVMKQYYDLEVSGTVENGKVWFFKTQTV